MQFSTHFITATHELSTLFHHVPAPYLRRSFTLEKLPEKAEITLCALGFYELFVNGERITRGLLSPYITNPDQLLPYDNYDILPYLRAGKNTLGFLLGNGMQNCFGGYVWDFHDTPFTSAPKIAFTVELTEDGGTTAFFADEQTLTHPSPVIGNELRMGEEYDARLEIPGWNTPEYDDTAWSPALPAESCAGEPMLADIAPILPTRTIRAVKIWKEDDGFVYDFGENCSGLTKLSVSAERGREITVCHAEKLENGKFSQRNILFCRPEYRDYPAYTQRTVYICKGEGREEYLPFFTYYGFRYARVTGISEEEATPELLTYVVMNTALSDMGGFACSDETCNALFAMTRRSDLANFFHFPTDCPHREKNGWTADAALSSEQMLLLFNPERNYRFWLRAITRAMNAEGALPGIVPTGGWGFAWGNGPAWDSVLIELPYRIWQMRGDLTPARECAGAILRYLHYLTARWDEKGLLAIGLGDWCAPGATAPLVFTDSTVSFAIAEKAARLYTALDMMPEAAYAEAIAGQMREAIRRHLCDHATMTFADGSQTAQAMAIAYGLCDSEEEESAAYAVLLSAIRAKDDHLFTGVLGARVILRLLADRGDADLALRLITRRDPPSFGYMVESGYTTLLETIHRDTDSCNHHFWGDVSAFMIEYLAGIRPDPHFAGADTFTVAPVFPKELSFAEAYHIFPAGKLSVRWERTEQGITLSLDIPAGLRGNIRLPSPWHFADNTAARPAQTGKYFITL